MPIYSDNVAIVEADVQADVPQGGGPLTGRKVEDGRLHNIFPATSDVNDAVGAVHLRKLGYVVETLDDDVLLGSRVVITRLPDNERKSYILFAQPDESAAAFDRRDEAADYMTGYFTPGVMFNAALLSNYGAGTTQLEMIQPPGAPPPPPRKTLYLVANEGGASEYGEYVRVASVEVSTRTHFDSQGYFDYQHLRLSLDDAIEYTYTGHEPVRSFSYSYSGGQARVRDTRVSDRFRAYGSVRLSHPAAVGDDEVRVEDVYVQVVPSNRTEVALTNQYLNPDVTITLSAGERDVTIPQQAQTFAQPVTAENRRSNWTFVIRPLPASETLTLYYMANGDWYALRLDANGILSGEDPAWGGGQMDAAGNLGVTTGALPDVDSIIYIVSATTVLYQPLAELAQDPLAPVFRATLPVSAEGMGVLPGSVRVIYDGVEIGSDAGSPPNGTISGTVSGLVEYVSRRVSISPALAPPLGALYRIEYKEVAYIETVWPMPTRDGAGDVTLNLGPNILPGSAKVAWDTDLTRPADAISPARVIDPILIGYDDGLGALHLANGEAVGTVDYALGNLTFTPDNIVKFPRQDFRKVGGGDTARLAFEGITYVDAPQIAPPDFTATTWHAVTGVETDRSYDLALDAVEIDLTPYSTNTVLPGSLRFTALGKTYDDQDGGLVTDLNGADFGAGSYDYGTGKAILTYWAAGAAWGVPLIRSGLTVFGEQWVYEAAFRTSQAPISSESLQLLGVTRDGTAINEQIDAQGAFTAPPVDGSANLQMGTGAVRFGEWVADAGLSAEDKLEWWYDAADVVAGQIFRPTPVMPSTLRLNAIVETYLPVDSNLIGVDTTRMSPDGRVVLFRKGGVVELIHRMEHGPVTVTAPQTVATRERVSFVTVLDANGDRVTAGWTLTRLTGAVDFTDVTDVPMPITIASYISDMRVCAEARIDGTVRLDKEVTHNYAAGETLLCAPLIGGDRWARVVSVWDQKTWNNAWVEYQVGDGAVASLNTLYHPITVTNVGADTELWAFKVISAATNQWQLIGRNRGLVWAGTYAPGGDDVAPINPRTQTYDAQSGTWSAGQPYLVIPAAANGGGWSDGNVVFILTQGANKAFWGGRCLMPGDPAPEGQVDLAEIHVLSNAQYEEV